MGLSEIKPGYYYLKISNWRYQIRKKSFPKYVSSNEMVNGVKEVSIPFYISRDYEVHFLH